MKKKCIIWVTPELPFPSNSGGRIYTWERMKAIKKEGYEIILFTISDNDDVNYEKLKEVCKDVFIFKRPNKYVKALKYFWSPFAVATRYIPKMREEILKYISYNDVDIIIADSLFIMKNCLNNHVPIILTQHNIEYITFKSMAIISRNIIKKIALYREYILCKLYETNLYNRKCIRGYTFISSKDKEFFEDRNPDLNTLHVPIGVNFDRNYINVDKIKKGVMVFTGKMDYEPNVQAVTYFANRIFPIIKEKISYAQFFIVGKSPTREVELLGAQEGITVTGFVESIEKYMLDANIFVIPLLSGGGVKIKLFEALSYKKIVVTTSKGIEGTSFIDGEDILVRECEYDFANTCVDIINNSDNYKKIGDNGFKHMVEKYSWNNIIKKYSEFIENAIYTGEK